jgi:hypothetical protein
VQLTIKGLIGRYLGQHIVFDRNLLFQDGTVPKCHLGVKEKNHKVVSGWIAVLRLFRDIGRDKLGASSGGNYRKLTVFRRNPDKPLH